MALLDQIEGPNDIKKLPQSDLDALAEEIRRFLVRNVSMTGGHLASNLGVVELTMALHLSLDLPNDKIVWDVGHQSYTHKILTGRKDGFMKLRQYGGISGFPKRAESECDVYDSGHSSTSISVALGMARARDMRDEKRTIVAVIGDGALTGGVAYEALNDVSGLSSNLIIVLNDNNMSISPNVGGLSSYLSEIRTSDGYIQLRDKIHDSLYDAVPGVVKGISRAKQSIKSLMVPGMFFEEMGITYLGPIDGHNIKHIQKSIEVAKRVNKAVLIHVCTKKGKGYLPAERKPAQFHGTPPFVVKTGQPAKAAKTESYTDVFSTEMLKIAEADPAMVAITAAMEDGVGLRSFHLSHPKRFFDVGIAEQHAVSFAAGLASGGLKPVFAVYSTFLQRAYDEIVEDVCLQNLPVVFAVDRAGLVGADGETHQGIFDLSYFSSMPGMTVMAPKNGQELRDMLRFAMDLGSPAAIRYPRGAAYKGLSEFRAPIEAGKSEILFEEGGVLLLAVGSMVRTAIKVRETLKERGLECSVANARFVRPLDTEFLREAAGKYSLVVTMEENVHSGGFGEHVAAWYAEQALNVPLLQIAIPDTFVTHGSPQELSRLTGIDAESVVSKILKKTGE
ncbi:MAG TPA: 1-deoxy-D-xylulose-5-phosphate synthase [Lachnospiraceae bacterium]|nr:1-deoxy-D-xylulose-5-phosphate synthase [Lachnospiraceae bacterium]